MNANCGCCEGVNPVTPEPMANRPGLDVLRYRVGTHASFFESMIAALTLSRDPALEKLTTRAFDDASMALLDAWATVADVLTFYQERIANEGYLRTATERRSILELGRLVGYELRPGVAASAYLAYTLEQNAEVEIPAGARAQSLPGPGELPQSFETAAPLKARGAWNYLEPRKTRPTVIEPKVDSANTRIQDAASVETIYLEGAATNLKANDRVLLVFNPDEPHRRVVSYAEPQFASNRTKVVLMLEERPNKIRTNDWDRPVDADLTTMIQRLAQGPAQRPESPAHVNRRVQDTFAATADAGPNLLAAANPLLRDSFYRAWENAKLSSAPKLLSVDALRVKAALFGHNAPLKPIINSQGVIEGSEEWPLFETLVITVEFTTRHGLENDAASRGPMLQVVLRRGAQTEAVAVNITGGEQNSSAAGFNVTIKRTGETLTTEITPVDNNPFGLSKTRIAVQSSNLEIRFKIDGDQERTIRAGQTAGYSAGNRRVTAQATEGSFVITQESPAEVSAAKRAQDARIIALDATYDEIVPGSWIVIERLDPKGDPRSPLVREVDKTATLTKSAFGITAKVTQLTLKEGWLDVDENPAWLDEYGHSLAAFRNTTVYAQNDPQKLAEEPVTEDVEKNDIELQNLYHGLESGRWLILTGERADIPGTDGVLAQELVMLSRIEQDVERDVPGSRTRSTLVLTNPLAYTYKRDTVRIYANVVKSTHGETRNEILGSGNGAEAFQRFTLKQPPLTYVPATNTSGVESTLVVRVNEVDWHRVDTLVDAGPRDRCYTTETDDAGRVTIIFGEGLHGARLPTGPQNVTSIYRNGIGRSGNVKRDQLSLLVTRPLGVKEATNPIAASGGADAESRDDARANVPLRLHALDRLVSVSDYEAFTRAFAGIGKARAEPLSDGQRSLVHLTIAGADDIPVDWNSDLYRHLILALRDLGDPQTSIEVQPRELLFLIISATVGLLPDYHWLDVERRLRVTLLDAFSFKRRQLGQDVVLSEVQAVMHAVPGVAYVDVDVLDGVSEFTPIDELRNLQATLVTQQPKPRVKVELARSNPLRGAQLAILTPDVPDTLILRGPDK